MRLTLKFITMRAVLNPCVNAQGSKDKSKKQKPREEVLNGDTYYVLPSVTLTEGVHAGSAGPLFYSAAELEASTPAWNSMPAVLDHPADAEGQSISARQPAVLDQRGVGYVFNSKFISADAATIPMLTGETWLHKKRLAEKHPAMAKKVANGETIEISTGLFCEIDETPGTWHDTPYDGSVHNIVADHLAVLPTSKGACSMAAGCGAGANQSISNAVCTCKNKADTKPGDTCSCQGTESVANATGDDLANSITAQVMNTLKARYGVGMITNAGMSVYSLVDQLSAWIRARYRIESTEQTPGQYAYLRDADCILNTFVFEVSGSAGLQLWQSSYTISEGIVTVSSDAPSQVTERKTHVPVAAPATPSPVHNEELLMSTSAPVTQPAAPAQMPFAGGYPAYPFPVQNGQFPMYAHPGFMPGMVPYGPAPVMNSAPVAPVAQVANATPAVVPAAPVAPVAPAPVANASMTMAEFLNSPSFPAHLKPVGNAMLAQLSAQRTAAIATVVNSAGNTMTSEQLTAMDHTLLMQIAGMAQGVQNAAQQHAPMIDPFTGMPVHNAEFNAGSSYAGAMAGMPAGGGPLAGCLLVRRH